MKNYQIIFAITMALASCAEQEAVIEETVICWSVGDEEYLPTEKYSPSPETICVPIVNAPALPPSIMKRAVIRNERSDRSDNPTRPRDVVNQPKDQQPVVNPTDSDPVIEFSETNDSGAAAGVRKRDGSIEYSRIDRDQGIVRAVDDETVTDADMARELVDRVFADVGI
jgi:hypothetical protein